ncbi:ABC transporter permease subunit [Schaalia sp. 19OD2882]|uniref:ABC transporter permease n=1 Tax=Schaalia sp. 19OD2882 TaxID=2794089 RepID=UPI001C1EA8BD|nr:ABC transporter permease subunit [Schaalia sp. 19OD2882]QWW19626.1 ABC transporter permease subunit [Schaalia sp. 19OD2882]
MNWLAENLGTIWDLTLTHVALAVPAVVASLVLSIPLGRLAHARPRLGRPLLSGLALVYAIPSLPLLIMVPVVLGTGLRSAVNMVVVLTLYGVAILVGQCARAFSDLPSDALASADAMGMGHFRRFGTIELPLALPVVMSGLRVVAASTISLVTVGAVVGVRSLGTLFTDGFQRGIIVEIIAGVLLTLGLALVLDLTIVGLTRMLTPWRRAGTGGAA